MKASLNHIFRTIWSEALNTWVAVSELTPSKGKSRSCVLNGAALAENDSESGNIAKSKTRLRLKLIIFALAYCFTLKAEANPTGAQIVSGSANVKQSGNLLTVTNSPNAIINWQGFSIGAGQTTNFIQQSASSSVLNRVVGPDPSSLLGTLTSNGRVYLINPAGILVGQGARIDVGSFISSSLNLSNADFLAGKLNFTAPSPAGGGSGEGAVSVINNGTITTPEGGSVYLVAPQVENYGVINTPKGETILAAGNTVQLMDTATPGVAVKITGSNNTATNLGQILADSGRIGVVGAVVNNSGTLSANSLVSQGGRVFLKASNSIEAGGTISAEGATGGGNISVLADMTNGTVNVTGTLDASVPSPAGGGLGRGSTSEGATNTSNGGFIETSAAHVTIADTAHITTEAANGKSGTWLIDPTDYTIAATNPGNGSSYMSNTTLATSLASGNITIQTLATGTGNGDIFVADPVTWTSTNSLTLSASNNININAALSGSAGGLVLNAPAGSITNNSTSGLISANTLQILSSGNVSLTGNNQINTVAANVSGVNSSFTLQNYTSSDFAVGTVSSALGITSGVTAGGAISIQQIYPYSGGIIVNNNVTSNSSDVLLRVSSLTGAATVATGATISGNNVTVQTSDGAITINGALTTKPTYTALLSAYTGTISGSGLITSNYIGLQSDGYSTGAIGSVDSPLHTSSIGGVGNANIWVGLNGTGPSLVYLNHTGSLTLGPYFVNSGSSTIDISATKNLIVNTAINVGTGTVSLRADSLGACVTNAGTCSNVSFGSISDTITAGTANIYYNPTGSNSSNPSYTSPTNFTSYVTNGTQLNTFMLVNDLTQLQAINFNTSTLSNNYALGRNIDATATANTGFSPIGNNSTSSQISQFNGTFDGLGHTISNLTINTPTYNYVGLFGYLSYGATVSNLGLVNANISGAGYVGALAGQNDGTITNSYVTASVSAIHDMGGMVGYNTGTISNSFAGGSITGHTGSDNSSNNYYHSFYVGGLVGLMYSGSVSGSNANVTVHGDEQVGGLVGSVLGGTISNSYVTGAVTGTSSSYGHIGGLVGWNGGTIYDSYATGNVSGSSYVGGLVGFNLNSTISNSYAKGNVTGSGSDIGGLVGYNYAHNSGAASINNSYATGAVTGAGNGTYYNIGGLVGFNYANGGTASINNSYATGFVSNTCGDCNTYSNAGGLVGLNGVSATLGGTANISNSYATGSVSGTGYNIGGLVGFNYGTISNSYATGNVGAGNYGTHVGGLVGLNNTGGIISNVYASGSVAGVTNLGGLVGNNVSGTITHGYWNSVANSFGIGGGTGSSSLIGGMSITSMQTASHFTGFNFTNTPGLSGNSWVIVNADGSLNSNGTSGGGTLPMLASEYSTSISNAHQLQLMAMNLGANYTLATNLYALATAGSVSDVWANSTFVSIGGLSTTTTPSTSFTGNFNGLGHTISNLTINLPNNYFVGLFGSTGSGSTIQNVGLLNVTVSGINNVGGLVGYNAGSVSNSSSTGTVSGGENVGGLVGTNFYRTVSNSSASGSVNGGSYVGGLVGKNYDATISNSYAIGTVSGATMVGGLLGYNYGVSSTISNSHATGTVSSSGNDVGGLIGYNQQGTISNSYASGSVSGSSYVGGLAGYNSGPITNSYASGNVTASGTIAGGLVGYNYGSISNSYYTTGSVSGTSDVGGLVGENAGQLGSISISNSYALGNVAGTGNNVGGLVGYNYGSNGYRISITTSFASGSVSGVGNVGGLIGYNYGNVSGSVVSINNSYATGNVTSIGNNAGGLVGFNYGKSGTASISNSYATGSVSGNNYVGGLVGENGGVGATNSYISNAYATGNVTGNNVGGLVGANYGTINNTYASGIVNWNGSNAYGGMVGYNDASGTITNSYWNDANYYGIYTDNSTSTVNVYGRSVSQMQTASNLTNFTFANNTLGGSNSSSWVIVNADGSLNLNGAGGGTLPMLASEYSTTIANAHQLQLMAMNLAGNYILGNTVDASATATTGDIWGSSTFVPIGNSSTQFTGTFDGQNHAIIGLTINQASSNVGLFGVSGASSVIQNVALNPASVTGGTVVGALAGTNYGLINNTNSSGNVSGTGTNGTGGLVGANHGTIDNSFATTTVSGGLTGQNVGGLVGSNTGTIETSYASGSVSGLAGIGGLAGVNLSGGVISNSYASGSVSGTTNIGGLVGSNYGSASGHTSISSSYATGNVSGTTSIGGLVGYNYGQGFGSATITGSHASGNVSGTVSGTVSGATNVGGLVGDNADSTVSASYATGSVISSSISGNNFGGLVGENGNPAYGGAITSSYATGNVSGTTSIGGLVGYNFAPANKVSTISNSYATGNVSGYSEVGGLVGYNQGISATANISNSYASGNVTGVSGTDTGTINVGGLVGENSSTGSGAIVSISNSYATGNVASSGTISGSYFGGLVGYNSSSSGSNSISNCYATGLVNVRASYVGGLVGFNYGGSGGTSSITNSYALGNVTGTGQDIGGLAGYNYGVASGVAAISNSYALGNVTGNIYVGGLVGGVNVYSTGSASVVNVYATGTVSGTVSGGLVGSNSGTVTGGYWNIDVNTYGIGAGTGSAVTTGGLSITSGAMRTLSNFSTFTPATGYATGDNWVIVDSDGTLNNANVSSTGATLPMLASEYSTTITNAHQLQLMAMNLAGNYTLGNNINAASTGNSTDVWGSSGFVPLGMNTGFLQVNQFTGSFNGQNHTISNLTINLPGTADVGLFGFVSGTTSVIQNVGLVGGSISGNTEVGELVGYHSGGTISNSYATGRVTGASNNNVGGLVGANYGTISNSYATVTVSGTGTNVGGLVGANVGTISNSYSMGSVSGSSSLGGLVGSNNGGTVTNSFWDIYTSGQTTSAGGMGLNPTSTSTQMLQLSSYTGWNIANTGGSGAVWRIYEGHTAPLLTSFLTPLTLTGAQDVSVTYSINPQTYTTTYTGSMQYGVNTLISGVIDAGSITNQSNAGVYNLYYSTQYDITGGNLIITPYVINLTGSRAYDGTTSVSAGTFTLGTLIGSDTLNLAGTGSVASAHVSAGSQNLSSGAFTLLDGTTGLASTNYTLIGGTQTATITAAPLIATGSISGTLTKTYDGTTTATYASASASGTVAGIAGDSLSLDLSGLTLNYNSAHHIDANMINATGGAMAFSIGGTNSNSGISDYSLIGLTIAPATGAQINAVQLSASASITAVNKVYDGTLVATGSTVSGSTSGTVVGSDLVALDTSGLSLNFSDAHVTTANKAISASGNVAVGAVTNSGSGNFSGSDANNLVVSQSTDYVLAAQPTIQPVSGTITARQLNATANIVAANKVYDGTLAATGSSVSGTVSGGFVGNDSITLDTSGVTLGFSDAHVLATGKTIGQTGGVVALGVLSSSGSGNFSGSDASNLVVSHAGDYELAAQPTILSVAAGNKITAAPLSFTGSMVYNAGTSLSAANFGTGGIITTGIGSETLALTGTGTVASQHVAAGSQTVNTTGLTLVSAGTGVTAGAASDYTFVGGTQTASITAAPINFTGSMVYNGGKSLVAGDFGTGGVITTGVGNETLSLTGAGTVASQHVAAGSQTVNTGGLTLNSTTGATAGTASDYMFVGGTQTASITAATLTASLSNTGVTKTYDGTLNAPTGFTPTYNITGYVAADSAASATLNDTGAAYSYAHVANNGSNALTVSGLTIGSITGSTVGSAPGDYTLNGVTSLSVASTITRKQLNSTANIVGTLTKVYDGTNTVSGATASVIGGVSGGVSGDTLSLDTSGISLAFNSPHVAVANSITASGSAVLGITSTVGSLPSDYIFATPSIATVTSGVSITPASVTWGIGAINWSAASNWPGGLLPTNGDVSLLTIPSGAVVTYSGGTTNMSSLTVTDSGSFIMAGGSLSLANFNAASYTQSAGTLTSGGIFAVTNSFSQSGGGIVLNGTTGVASITQATGDLSIANLNAPVVNLVASSGAILQTGPIVATTLVTHSATNTTLTDTGNQFSLLNVITTSGGIDIFNAPATAVTLGVLTAGGTNSPITYSQNGYDLNIVSTVTSTGGSILIDPPANVNMSNGASISSGGGSIGLQALGNVVLANINAGSNGAVNLTAGGNVSSAPGYSGPNITGGIATINVGGNAFFNTSVQTLNVTVGGVYSITDGSVVFSSAPLSVQQLINITTTATSTNVQGAGNVQDLFNLNNSLPNDNYFQALLNATQPTIGNSSGSFGGCSDSGLGACGDSGNNGGTGNSGNTPNTTDQNNSNGKPNAKPNKC